MHTYWLIAGLFVLGALAGAVVRLPLFAIVLVLAGVAALLGTWSQGAIPAVLHLLLAVVMLQVGYVAGVVLRSVLQSLRARRAEPSRLGEQSQVRVPSETKRR